MGQRYVALVEWILRLHQPWQTLGSLILMTGTAAPFLILLYALFEALLVLTGSAFLALVVFVVAVYWMGSQTTT